MYFPAGGAVGTVAASAAVVIPASASVIPAAIAAAPGAAAQSQVVTVASVQCHLSSPPPLFLSPS